MDLTTQQQQAVESGEAVPLIVGHTECVLIRKDVYEWAKQLATYDDSEWTPEEMDLLAGEAADRLDDPSVGGIQCCSGNSRRGA